jgi:hypothetical protein
MRATARLKQLSTRRLRVPREIESGINTIRAGITALVERPWCVEKSR